jgi:biotin synthase-related radical SAM superfamily protein
MDDERAAKNEALFRDVNERIAESAQRFDSREAEFVCECADAGCAERVATPIDVYEQVRSDGATFIVKPGHEDERFERVVERRSKFRIVEKLNVVGRIARSLDPRTA